MVGQFPEGVELHVRNLQWFLRGLDYHIYIVTTPKVFDNIDINTAEVTFITRPTAQDEFAENPQTGYVNFWRWFPTLIKNYRIEPEWFLFMEQDLWFFEQFDSFPPSDTVKTFYREPGEYHNIMLNDEILQPHLWEGTTLVNSAIVTRALKAKVRFGYYAESFFDRNRERYEGLFGGKITIAQWTRPETMGEFSLYCALEERVQWQEVEKAVHLRGPEIVHRKCAEFYRGGTQESVTAVQAALPDVDIYTAVAVYYIAGAWRRREQIDWRNASEELEHSLLKVAATAGHWMAPEQYSRLLEVLAQIEKARGRDSRAT